MSKININQPIVDIYGNQIEDEKLRFTDKDPIELELLTVKNVCIKALIRPKPFVYGPTGNVIQEGDPDKVKFEKWDLYKKFRDNTTGFVELNNEEFALLMIVVIENNSQLIAGQIRDLVEES